MKRIRKNESYDADLADVNEQELAKSSQRETYFGAESETDADNANGGSAPVLDCDPPKNDAQSDNISEEQTEVILHSSDKSTLPCSIPHKDEPHLENDDKGKETDTVDRGQTNVEKDRSSVQREKRRRRGGGYIFVTCLCMIVSIAILILTLMGGADKTEFVEDTYKGESVPLDTADTQEPHNTVGQAFIYEKCSEATVTVCSYKDGKTEYYTGICVFGDGYIATLYQAVADVERVEITLSDGTVLSARSVGGDATANIALIQAEGTLSYHVTVGSADSLEVGEEIYVIGSAGNGRYGSSLSVGVVSYGQRTPQLEGFDGKSRRVSAIQLSGSFDKSMMGAPVFDLDGNAVAMMLSIDDSFVSFALPLDRIASVLDMIRRGETPSSDDIRALAYVPPSLGILGSQTPFEDGWGIAVKGFSDMSADAASVLKLDDIIFKINDTPTPDTAALMQEIDKHRPNDEVEVFVFRNGQKLSFLIKLCEL